MRKAFSVIAVLLVSVMLFASGAGEAESSDTLQVMLTSEPGEGDSLFTMLQKWADESGVQLDTLIIPDDDQLQRFPLMAKNGDLPDLIVTTRLTRLYPDEFEDLGDVIDISIFEPQALTIISEDYNTTANYCLPYEFTITNVFYNKTAFEKAGIEPPTVEDPWTLEEFRENAQILQEKGGVRYGIAMDGSRARYDNLMYLYGGSMVEKEGDSFAVTVNGPGSVAALEMFVEWNNSVMPKAVWAGGTSDNPSDYFTNGLVGIFFSGSWNYNPYTQNIKDFEWGVIPSPVGPDGSRSAILGGTGFAVPKEAENKELAYDFLTWFYEEEHFQEFLNLDKGLSSLKDIIYEPSDEKIASDYAVMQAEAANVQDAFNIDESSMWRNYYDNEYRDALRQAVYGDLTPQEALDGFAKRLADKSGWSLKYTV